MLKFFENLKKKGLKFVSFPYIISLQLNRFDFDYTTMSRFKLSNTVTFPEILDVKKYLIPDKEDTSETNIKENEKGADEQEGEKAESKSNDNELTKYELFSIMIHSGSATGGHYYAYIKCFETDQWYNFNDERVTKLDRQDIKKAFGTSNSTYSSTTAYMLLYRQINPERNEKFITVEEYSDYLKMTLEKEKNSQVEAEKLKEFMENSCKIKVIVPELNSDINNNSDKTKNNIVDDEKTKENLHNNQTIVPSMLTNEILAPTSLAATAPAANPNVQLKRQEKSISIHKDLTLDMAKLEIIKVNSSF